MDSSLHQVIIHVEGINKSFKVAGGPVQVLKDISFDINSSEFAIIYGPSGCGKSTLLHTILGLEKPDSGRIVILDNDIYDKKSEDELALFRKKNIGMVYQSSHWVKAINVVENVALPLTLMGIRKEERLHEASEMLRSVQMTEWAGYNPSELSSGQQQKVSLARALINNPQIIIADEPTGNLDYESGIALMNMLKKLSTNYQKTILMVTHDLEYLKIADKAISLFDGQVIKIYSPQLDKDELWKNLVKLKK